MIEYLIAENLDFGQHIYEFPNGYGASVVKNNRSYGANKGLYEIAVLYFYEGGYTLIYDTPVTDDVIGFVEFDDIDGWLKQIHDLPARTVHPRPEGRWQEFIRITGKNKAVVISKLE